MGEFVGLKFCLNSGPLQCHRVDMHAARQAGSMPAVIRWVGETAVQACWFGQFEVEIFEIGKAGQSFWLQRNGD